MCFAPETPQFSWKLFLPGLLLLALFAVASLPARAEERADESAALIVDGWRHRVWCVYPPEKIKADQNLPTARRMDVLRLSAARGEYEPLVLVVRPDVPLRDVEVVAADFHGPEGSAIRRENVTWRRMAYIYVDEPSGTRIRDPMPYETGTGMIPDPLVSGKAVARPGRNLQFWVSVHVPRDARPGAYEGVLEVRFRKEGWMPEGKINPVVRLPVALTVRRFALPERTPLLNTAFFAPGLLNVRQREPEALRRLYREFGDHRQVPEPILPSPAVKVAKDGTLTVDTTEWEKTAQFLLDELHTPHLFLPVWGIHPEPTMLQGIYFLWHYPAITKQRWFGPQIADAERRLTPDFQRQFGAYLEQMTAVLTRRGWLDRVYLTTMDEPYTYHTDDRKLDTPANNYEMLRNYVTFVRQHAPGIKTFVTADPAPEINGLIDHWCLRNLKNAPAARDRAQKHGEVFTFCDNYRTFVDYPMVSPRSLGWLAWKIGARGWLTYETLGGLATAWEGPVTAYPMFSGATVWGLGQMFYPSPVGDELIPSLRWEMMRKGCEDYEYLWLLRQRLDALPAAQRDSPPAQQARQLLDTAADEVVGGSGDPETASAAARPNAQSNRVPHALREKAAELLEQLDAR